MFGIDVDPADMAEARKRVANGAELMNEFRPGFRDRVALTSLDISSAGACMLGQEYGDFSDGLDALRKDVRAAGRSVGNYFAQDHGFQDGYAEDYGISVSYEALTIAWREEVFGRPMNAQEKFAASVSDQVSQVAKLRRNAEKELAATLKRIAELEQRVIDLTADENSGREMVDRILNS
jgi:hypothetical protein